jgi:hypothetical protein
MFTLITAGLYSQGIAGMIVKHGQRVTSPIDNRDMSFKVHLPKIVRSFSFKPLPSMVFTRFLMVNQPIASQNIGDCARSRHSLQAQRLKSSVDLSTTPSRVTFSESNHSLFNLIRSNPRNGFGSPRAICNTRIAMAPISSYPLVSGFTANTKPAAKFAKIGSFFKSQEDKFFTLRHNGNRLPWHMRPPF